jgi:calcineurin-like phosphoesterase family protein
MTIYIISDTHFGHENIIKYSSRPFANAAEMDEAMVANWNAVVKPSDHVYHLGDVAMRAQHLDAVMPRLNGHKRLVRGNHDIFKTKKYLKWFEEIHGMRVMDNMLFTHVPIHPGSLGRFRANVHGHTHESTALAFPYVNVCVEQTGYTPISLEYLSAKVREAELVKSVIG